MQTVQGIRDAQLDVRLEPVEVQELSHEPAARGFHLPGGRDEHVQPLDAEAPQEVQVEPSLSRESGQLLVHRMHVDLPAQNPVPQCDQGSPQLFDHSQDEVALVPLVSRAGDSAGTRASE